MKAWFAVGLAAALFFGSAPAKANLLSADDEKTYRQAFEAAHNDHYDWAKAAAAKAHDKLLAKVLQWQNFTQPNSGASFADITAFMSANPEWPQTSTLERRAEEAITVATPDQAILEWFSTHSPQTVDGVIAYGKALMGTGDNEKTEKLVRARWVSGNFGPIQEHEFLSNFQEMLTDEDDEARLDRLLWEHQDQAVAHQIQRVDDAHQLLAQARMALNSDAANAETLAAQVPDRLKNDSGLIYEKVRYRRLHDKDEQAIALLNSPSADKTRPDLWWTERAVLARRLLQQGRISEAYQITRNHRQSEGAGFAEAEWLSGWIALRFLNDRDVALTHFSRMYDRVATAQSRSRAAYWAGRASDALGHGDDAVRWYNLAATHVTTFYGQLAAGRLNHDQMWPLPADPLPNAQDIEQFERHELVHAAKMLGQIKETDLIRPFMQRMAELATTPGMRALAADLATNLGRADIAVAVAKRSEREGVPLITSGYPIPHVKTGETPERALVMGLIRQESAFHDEAVSSAGARGLMQLMPTTAAKVAKALNLVFKKKEALANALTANPNLNVKLGSAYLGDLLSDFNGSYVLSVASYNAGPSRIRKWMRDMGDPRQPEIDAIDWIESIPFAETRNYVQRVLEGVQVYRRRFGATDLSLSLEGDIKR
ncbi:transglycosylase SLT domain-containing protein [Telmatospirillum sp.]|uniref:lytic transglycosylase domain-containing protein n=1 Tax=Telmatospirillum sp. TaxID=2079197 RepID=UPI00284450DB|nr:transglycosylase SLT domain-containing protein [Telmatospirillum sp.]MDR3435500.1 transglycosylase SLT domain-containing protein [Telmatospirillum sp.]